MTRWLVPWAVVCVGVAGCPGGLVVTGVEPAIVAPGGTVTISGGGFSAETVFVLVEGNTEIQLQEPAVRAADQATAVVPAAAPNGTYAMAARAGGAEARKDDAVSVRADSATFHFVDIGQGDGTLVVAPTGEVLLIDGGPRDDYPALRAAWDAAGGRLDAVILSHTDADHLGGLFELMRGDDGTAGSADDLTPLIAYSYVDDGSCDSILCNQTRGLRAWPFEVARVGTTFPLGEVEVEIVAADGDVGSGPLAGVDADNERSVVALVRYAGRSVLITGDLTGGGLGDVDLETPLAARIGPVDVLRAAHHGSATSSPLSALGAYAPRAVVVSLGTDNSYCHPASEVTDAFAALGAPVYATGSGILADGARCGGVTDWPAGARVGLGTIKLSIGADGSLTLAGDAL